ncbi:MAG TPA: RnfH family protein [Steroidobacteraceae bacterium]|jgi:hypothetical protein|nr:RnfH family protein [Steroidobacteraceae bacterium]
MSGRRLDIEVVHAGKERVIVQSYRLEEGARVADALRLAAADPAFAGVEVLHAPAGIFGRLSPGEAPLEDGDRVEIYRPLEADPKVARRVRAAESRRRP